MNRVLKYFLSLMFVYVATASNLQVYAQVSVEVKIDTAMMLIGDQTYVTVGASFPENTNIQLPFFADTIINKLEILEVLNIDTVSKDGVLRIEQKYLVTSFDSGWYVIPPANFIINFTPNRIDTIQSVPVYFGVMTMPLDTANANSITDIKPPLGAPVTFAEAAPYVGTGLGILLVLFGLYVIYRRFVKKKPVFILKEKPKEPAHIIAYSELDKLRDDKLWQRGLVKEYYSKLTEVLRVYMEDRFDILAMESTTDEILNSLKTHPAIEKQVLAELQLLLVQADFVKFAKADPLADQNEKSMQFAYGFVTRTKQVEEPVVETGLPEGNDEQNKN